MNEIDERLIKVVKDAVVTVPGVISFANYQVSSNKVSELKTTDVHEAIELIGLDNLTRFRIHVILINGVNVKDVINEIQIRVKYELEKLSKFTIKYQVDVAVDGLDTN